MKKRVFGKKFSRSQKSRRALLRSLVREFVLHGEITTTAARAKFLKPTIDRLVTMAKRGDLEAHRRIYAFLAQDKEATVNIEEAAKRFKDRSSGFTKTERLGVRRGDVAPLTKISWIKYKEIGT